MAQPPKGKRLYLINRDFQLRYTRIAVLVGIVSTAVTLVLILYPLVHFQIIRFPNFVPTPFLWAIGMAAVLNILIVACMGVLITHRIAGPMFSLVRHINRLQSGHFVPPLRVRDGDDLKYLVRNFNALTEYLRDLAVGDKDQLDTVVEHLKAGEAQEARKVAEALQGDYAVRLTEGLTTGLTKGNSPA